MTRLARILTGLALSFGLFVIGAAAGGFLGKLTSSGMGWDQLGNVLGGIALGAAIGVLGAVLFARSARPIILRRVTITVLAAAGVLLVLLTARVRTG